MSQLFFQALQPDGTFPLARDKPGSAAPSEYAHGGEVLRLRGAPSGSQATEAGAAAAAGKATTSGVERFKQSLKRERRNQAKTPEQLKQDWYTKQIRSYNVFLRLAYQPYVRIPATTTPRGWA